MSRNQPATRAAHYASELRAYRRALLTRRAMQAAIALAIILLAGSFGAAIIEYDTREAKGLPASYAFAVVTLIAAKAFAVLALCLHDPRGAIRAPRNPRAYKVTWRTR